MIWRTRPVQAARGGAVTDDLEGVRLLLLAGRSPDEQHVLLDRLGCLSSRGKADRMGVIRLLDRVYEAQVKLGMPPFSPSATTDPTLVDAGELLGPTSSADRAATMSGVGESYRQRLARYQARALADAGFLDPAACRAEDVSAWWVAAWPTVCAVHEEQRAIFAAVAPDPPGRGDQGGNGGKGKKAETDDEHDHVTAFRAVLTPIPQTKPIQRTDPITCPTCGRPAPRRATYCVWCGLWLAARPR